MVAPYGRVPFYPWAVALASDHPLWGPGHRWLVRRWSPLPVGSLSMGAAFAAKHACRLSASIFSCNKNT
ncbi:hypothetical protein GW17_00051271 [Ensete ventricosum]|nr:hypothetical protein GW17_00051271 [Ensete ventricosum]